MWSCVGGRGALRGNLAGESTRAIIFQESRYPTGYGLPRSCYCELDSVTPATGIPDVAGPNVHTSIPPALASAWANTLSSWGDSSKHDLVLGLAAKHEQYAWLAARYREAARANPDDPIPPARLERLQRAALATLCFERRAPQTEERKPYRNVLLLLAATMFATVVGLWLVDMKTSEYQQRQPPLTSKTR